jgi:hypothetical protein
MSFDPSFPVTGSTLWSVLYAGLRSNFAALDSQFAVEDWKTDIGPYSSAWTAVTPFKYLKDPFGFVHLTGKYITNSYAPSYFLTNANLPVGYRPSVGVYFSKNTYKTTGTLQTCSYVSISTAGVVFCGLHDYVGCSACFDGIIFKAA